MGVLVTTCQCLTKTPSPSAPGLGSTAFVPETLKDRRSLWPSSTWASPPLNTISCVSRTHSTRLCLERWRTTAGRAMMMLFIISQRTVSNVIIVRGRRGVERERERIATGRTILIVFIISLRMDKRNREVGNQMEQIWIAFCVSAHGFLLLNVWLICVCACYLTVQNWDIATTIECSHLTVIA